MKVRGSVEFDAGWTGLINLVDGVIEFQIDHLKCIQTKLTLFSLQSNKCVSKVSEQLFSKNNSLKLIHLGGSITQWMCSSIIYSE